MLKGLEIDFVIDIMKEVRRAVNPLVGTPEGGEKISPGAGGDITRRIDRLAEDLIVKRLSSRLEAFILVSEEAGMKSFGSDPKIHVIVDSIDGTTNATRGLPFYCTSIAFSNTDHLSGVYLGVVMDLRLGETFYAQKGQGSFVDGRPITTSKADDLIDGVIGLDLCRIREEQLEGIKRLILEAKHTRHFGANGLEICHVAAGRYDAFVDVRERLRATDLAAAQLILREAGGLIVQPDGSPLEMKLEPTSRAAFVACGNESLCRRIFRLMR